MHKRPLSKPITFFAPTEGGEGGGSGSGNGTEGTPEAGKTTEGTTFTQADVDRIVGDRVKRTEAKYSDYDALKAKASTVDALEQKIGDLEPKVTQTEQRALRAEIAAEFGVSTKRGEKNEPSDAELFLTGTDADTLRSQAQRLIGRERHSTANNNHAPTEGYTKTPPADGKRTWLRSLRQD